MLTRNGSCVTAIMKSSAGSSRRHGAEKGSPTFPFRLTFSVASAAVTVTTESLPDRARRDFLALTQRRAALRRPGDHAREELGAPIADVLELRNADILHTR